ncbi:protein-PII uridylyltransferase, partial [Bifidobacterium animalis subsp. lactis]
MAMSTLKQQFLELSEPDAAGVYRNGSAQRMARTNLAMRALEALWNEAVHSVPLQIPDSGIGLAAGGSLARGQIGPASDLDL